MTHEWKVGDRFTLEFEVVKIRRHSHAEWEVDATTTCEEDMSFFSQSQMDHAKLIAPAPEENPLDVAKPMRFRGGITEHRYVGRLSNGEIVVEQLVAGRYLATAHHESELENIPEPKITTADVLSLWKFKSGERLFLWGACACATRISQARVSYTEGEGWSICEAES